MLASCSKLPQQAEIEYRTNLENAMVETFPHKVVVVIHPFENLSPNDTNRAYLEQAVPDSIEAMLESLRSSLAYVPFDGMPFYVSSSLSNLMQSISTISAITNTNDFDEGVDVEQFELTNESEFQYFTYLTNYLLVVPTQETQLEYLTTTNTNYYNVETNIVFLNAVPVTNVVSNEVLSTTTNETKTNLAIVNKNILTPTNMLIMLYEEFPELTNYLSFMPIEIRRADSQDIESYKDYYLRLTNRAAWLRQQGESNQVEGDMPDYPSDKFEYIYHIGGDYSTKTGASMFGPAEVTISLRLLPAISTGDWWWEAKYGVLPPKLSGILDFMKTLYDEDSYKEALIRNPYEKEPISPRLLDELEEYSTNFREDRPETPENPLPARDRPLLLKLVASEQDIPTRIQEWLKYFHSAIVNRPYSPLIVDTDPEGTLIYMDGVYIGKTPLTYPTAPLGSHRILFLQDGYSREEVYIDVQPNQTNSLFYELQVLNNTGTIRVTSTMPDAEVYLNSLYQGKTPLIISNMVLDTRYRVEVLNPKSDLASNRNSVYKTITLTSNVPSVDIDAQFKDFETVYQEPAQKALLAATYVSWFTTMALLGAGFYTQYRYREAQDLIYNFGTASTDADTAQLNKYRYDEYRFSISSQATLYSAIAMAVISTGIMGWYLYSKDIYLGFDYNPADREWYAKFKLGF